MFVQHRLGPELRPYHLEGLALRYLVSGASLEAAAGAVLVGPLSDRFGREEGRGKPRPSSL